MDVLKTTSPTVVVSKAPNALPLKTVPSARAKIADTATKTPDIDIE